MSLLEIRNLKKHFPVGEGLFSRGKGAVKAVDGVNLSINEGETLGLVGESGCGKSTLGRTILRLIEPTSGEINFLGKNLLSLSQRELRDTRREMQIIFQDPYASLNPRMRVGHALAEVMLVHRLAPRSEVPARVERLLGRVGLPASAASGYPAAFSGGQRQRICIARALAAEPEILIADEPVSALDVSIQAQVVNLLLDLKEQLGLAIIFIGHDLQLVNFIAPRIVIMLGGRIVETIPEDRELSAAEHPYTRELLEAVPRLETLRPAAAEIAP